MPSGHVESIDALRDLQAALVALGEQWQEAADQLRRLARQIEGFVRDDRRQYWNQQMRLAERQLNAAEEALARTQITDDTRTRRGSTEARIAVQRCKQRVQLCREKQLACRRVALEMDRSIDHFVGELGALAESGGQQLPQAAAWLASRIDDLRRYAEASRA